MTEKKYFTTWRNKWITSHANSIDDFIDTFEYLAKKFRKWKGWGIELLDDGGVGDDYASFVTDNMDVAIKAGFTFTTVNNEETEYLETLSGETILVPKSKIDKL